MFREQDVMVAWNF